MITSKFSKAMMETCANLCLRVYKNPSIERGALSADVMVAATGVQYVVFTGSENLLNWLMNGIFLKEGDSFFKGKVHRGFLASFRGLRTYVMGRLTQDPIVVTGHSLGGSMAVLMARYLVHCGYNVKCVYTFGKPRVGDEDWKKDYNENVSSSYRVVNKLDLIPTLPKIGYYHEGTSIVLDGKDISTYQKVRTTMSFLTNPLDGGLNHLIKTYCETISKLKKTKNEDK